MKRIKFVNLHKYIAHISAYCIADVNKKILVLEEMFNKLCNIASDK